MRNEEFFKELMAEHIREAKNQLHKHINNANISGSLIMWQGGCYNGRLIDALERALKQGQHEWPVMVWRFLATQERE